MTARKQSRQDQSIINTLSAPRERILLQAYGEIRPGISWDTGVGAYRKPYDFNELKQRLECLEEFMELGMKPAILDILRTLMRHDQYLKKYDVSDTMPAASSPAYEWYSQLKKVTYTIENMLDVFDDLNNRLGCYVSLIQQIKDMLKLARSLGNKNAREAVLILHDALCGTYSEDLTRSQVETIKNVANYLDDLDLTRDEVRALDRDLRESGLETVPSDRFVGAYSEKRGT